MANMAHPPAVEAAGETRRDFLLHTTIAMGVVGSGMMVWPLIHSMNPAADTLSLSTAEFNISGVAEGQRITVVWRGRPVFVAHRTAKEIDDARKVDVAELRDPETDDARVKKGKEQYLILEGNCTHLGCIPMGVKATEPHGDYGGWFCPCHGSHYDTAGRIRRGPAPLNLRVPPYQFLSDTTVRIG
ncbi:MAG: ubiquinol-cytochrome c reductase iron-sulfur subunit [Rhodospirillaceae bacterium]|nr:ubiquinol-cytochrome c reductase iron-sulfur subunit [Rhodospirillaceae bacterium]